MESKKLAQGIASLGRYGDTTLMHMRPDEVNNSQLYQEPMVGTLQSTQKQECLKHS
jgi:hypothetical protein